MKFLRKYDRPWMNRKLRTVNLRLDRALLGPGLPHVGFVGTTTIGREEYTAHGLHLNSRGKRRLTLLIADRLEGVMCRVWVVSLSSSLLEPLLF